MNMKKGFTLIEIMIVVAIIAILAAIAIPNFIAYRQTAQLNACKSNMKTIKNACEAYTVKTGDSATSANLCDSTNGSPFLKSFPTCPIGGTTGTYTISYDSANQAYTITCGNNGSAHAVNETTTTAE